MYGLFSLLLPNQFSCHLSYSMSKWFYMWFFGRNNHIFKYFRVG